MTSTILIIDDEEDIIEGLTFVLEDEGYKVFSYTSGLNALKEIKSCNPDLILLDLMLPDVDGINICKNLKANIETCHIPILILSSRSTEQEVIAGLDSGCNDYITKPFSEKILLAKIKSHLKISRQKRNNDKVIKFKKLIMNTENYEVVIDNKKIDLTPTEFKVLYCMLDKIGKVLDREKIIDCIDPNYEKEMSLKSIDIMVTRIRKKLGDYAKYIESIYGVGYRFKKEIV